MSGGKQKTLASFFGGGAKKPVAAAAPAQEAQTADGALPWSPPLRPPGSAQGTPNSVHDMGRHPRVPCLPDGFRAIL